MTTSDPLSGMRLGVVGCGVMAEAILAGLLGRNLISPDAITCSHPREARRQELHDRHGVNVVAHNSEAARGADLVLLGIKPQVLPRVLPELSPVITEEQLVISIIAGATTKALSEGLNHPHVVRAMPNTPAQIGRGVTVWQATPSVTELQRQRARHVLEALGEAIEVHDERQVAMATALSGTGPTYIFLFIEALTDAGVHLGFARQVARQLVLQTLVGSAEFAISSGKHVAELRDMVTSPGGTSAEALYQMEAGRLRTVLSDAVWAAFGRTLELEARLENRPADQHPRGTPGRP
jgi:pyrroline-5-carboxylate reductase